MVRNSILLGAIPLAGLASGIFIPHEDDPNFLSFAADTNPQDMSTKVQAAAAEHLPNPEDNEDEMPHKGGRKMPCPGMRMRHAVHHGPGHHGPGHHKGPHHKPPHHKPPHHGPDGPDGPDGPEEPPKEGDEELAEAEHKKHGKHGKHGKHHKGGKHGKHHKDHKDNDDSDSDSEPELDEESVPHHHNKHGKHGKHHKEAGSMRNLDISSDYQGVLSFAAEENVIPDSYIVVLKSDAPEDANTGIMDFLLKTSSSTMQTLVAAGDAHPLLETDTGFEVKNVFDRKDSIFRGFAAKLLPGVAELLADLPEVAFVEKDSIVHALKSAEEDQAPWGLARVSHREHLGLGTYNKYLYDSEAGEGVTSYIVDTGIYVDHKDFEGRAVWGKTMPQGDVDVDAHGHGSHCAGTIGGNKYGIAKKAKLVAVKVLGSDGSGTMSDVIGGVEYVVESHRKEKASNKDHKGSTANMSLGGGKSPSLDLAVNAATKAGVHFAVAAGNENQDACNTSPAAAAGAVTVGASTVSDERAYFSNWGKCVDIFAPGYNILSVGTTDPTASAVMSGTSMAAPHIAGLLTYFLSLQPSTDSLYATRSEISASELKKYLLGYGTSNIISELDDESPNLLAFNGGGKKLGSFWNPEEAEEDEESVFKIGLEKAGHILEEAVEHIGDMFDPRHVASLI